MENAITFTTYTLHKLPAYVRDYFGKYQGKFGALNLLPSHLPDEEREHELVKNWLTIDYGLGYFSGYDNYRNWINEFCDKHVSYKRHISHLNSCSEDELLSLYGNAKHNSVDTLNLFSPAKCNLYCKGCYTAAVPLSRTPYTDEEIQLYFTGFTGIIEQALPLGLKTIYTSGDGEITTNPLFFDLVDEIAKRNLQWLFFTAGIIFSNEDAAKDYWINAKKYLKQETTHKINSLIDMFNSRKSKKPVINAFLSYLRCYRDFLQIYHSVWSLNAAVNEKYRSPTNYKYDNTNVTIDGQICEFPSGIIDLLTNVFDGEYNRRFGLQMPCGGFNTKDVFLASKFVVNNDICSYFEPIIHTGRNSRDALENINKQQQDEFSPLFVRSSCSFRNIYQPTIKFDESGFISSPGMGIKTKWLRDAANDICDISSSGLFSSIHSPLQVYMNYTHTTGCKCDFIASEMISNREKLRSKWRKLSDEQHSINFHPEKN